MVPHINPSLLPNIDGVHYVGAVTATGLSLPLPGRQRVIETIERIDCKQDLLFVFGEIDCRAHLPSHNGMVKQSAENYLRFLEFVAMDMGREIYAWGVVSPAFDHPLRYARFKETETRIARRRATMEFNSVLRQALNGRFICIDDKISSQPKYFMDGLHLGVRALPLIEEALNLILGGQDE